MAIPIPPIERISRQDLSLEATSRLARFVAAAEPGSRLPTEKELCEQLGVGRSTLREAMRSLAFIGAVQSRQGSGTFVSTLEERAVDKLIGLGLMLQRSKVQEVIEVRRMLEVEAARLAAECYDEGDRGELEEVMRRMEASTGDPAEASRHDLEFHVRLARASHNSVLLHFLNGMRSLLEIWINRAVNREPVVADIVREHNDVLRAVFQRHGERAAAAMFLHQTNAAERLFATVGRDRVTSEYLPLLLAAKHEPYA